MSDIVSLLSSQPTMAAGYQAMTEELWAHGVIDPVLLELVRIRICQLHGDRVGSAERTPAALAAGLDESLVASLSEWPTHDRFDDRLRCALGIAELFVIDVHAVTDEQTEALQRHLNASEMVAFSVALGLFDGFTRFRLVRAAGL